MNKQEWIRGGVLVALFVLITLANSQAFSLYGMNWTDYRHSAITIGDGKNTSLNGTVLGNGYISDVACLKNCTNFSGTSGTWINCSLINSWANVATYQICRFRKTANNETEFSGVINGGLSNSVAFTLPAGYIPKVDEISAAGGSNAGVAVGASIYIDEATGYVFGRYAAATDTIGLAGISIPLD